VARSPTGGTDAAHTQDGTEDRLTWRWPMPIFDELTSDLAAQWRDAEAF
jgi:hypothetical protein